MWLFGQTFDQNLHFFLWHVSAVALNVFHRFHHFFSECKWRTAQTKLTSSPAWTLNSLEHFISSTRFSSYFFPHMCYYNSNFRFWRAENSSVQLCSSGNSENLIAHRAKFTFLLFLIQNLKLIFVLNIWTVNYIVRVESSCWFGT